MNLSAGGAAAGGPGALFSPDDLACPICVETIEDAFATPCGHTFCFKCISTHLKNKSTCPSCGAHLVQDQIHPNFLLNKLIKRAATVQDSQSLKTALLQHVQHDLAAAGSSIGLQELDAAIQLLQDKRQQLATHESSNKLQLLMLFLQHAKAKQLGQLSELEQQLDVLQQDLAKARAAAAAAGGAGGNGNDQQQQQQQQQLNGVGSVQDHAAAAAAAGSRSATPPQQQLQPLLGHPPAAAAAAGEAGGVSAGLGGSLVGGRSSAFTRLPPAGGHGQQSEQQQQQGLRPLGSTPQQQPQQGFRPLPTPQPSPQQQQQQQQAAPSQLPSQPQQQQQQPPLQQQQQQQQAAPSQLPSQPQQQQQQPPLQQQQQQAMGVGPLPRPQQQQQQQTTVIGQRGFRPFTPPTQQQAAQSPTQAGPAVLPKSNPLEPAARQEQKPAVGFQGFRPFGAQQGATAGEPAAVAAAAGGGGMGAANGAAGPAQQQQQQQGFRPLPQQQQQQQGFRPLPPAQDPMQPIQQQQQQQQQGFRPLPASQGLDDASLNPEKKRKILEQFDELQQAYLNSRIRRQSTGSQPSPAAAAEGAAAGIQAPQQAAVAAAAGVAAVQQQQKQQWKWPEGAALNDGNVDQQSSRPDLQVKATTALQQQPQQGRGQHLVAAAGAGGSNARPAAPAAPTAAAAAAAPGGPVGGVQPGQGDEGVLDAFSRMLYAVTHYSKLQPLAYVPSSANRAGGGAGGAQILSSVDFDCAGRLFAAAGVQQRILVHDYQSVLTHGGPPQQQQPQQQQPAAGSDAAGDTALLPMLDLATGSKISCVSFSPAVQQYLLSSDYAGVVQLWDLTGGRTVRQWEAHDKRIWAVDFCPLDPTTFATGSDDGTVKVWGLCEAPVPRLTLPVRANVCSIKFSPANPHMLAAGNAGHQVHLFDLRSPRAPLAVLKGHNKAVSYVRWAGADTLVTASTDSTLRLWTASGGRGCSDSAAGQQQQQQQQAAGSSWDAEEGGWHCSQIFRGHANSKHFVGLATQGPFIACGSETNEVFMYHQGLAQPSLKCLLNPWEGSSSSSGLGGDGAGAGGNSGAEGGGPSTAVAAAAGGGAGGAAAAGAGSAGGKSPFVSALCWKKDSDVLVAANSKGGVWVLSMQ